MEVSTSNEKLLDWRTGEVGLLVIDLSRTFTQRGSHFDRNLQGDGIDTTYYFDRLEFVVTPAVNSLACAVRGAGGPVLWVKPMIVDPLGRDWPPGFHRPRLAPLVPGVDSWELLDGLISESTDYEVPKQCVSAFWCGNADSILRNRGVRHVLVAGCFTNGGAMVNAVDAATRGYQVTLVDDACAALSPELHEAALAAHSM